MPVREPEMVKCSFIHNGKTIEYQIHKDEYEGIQNIKKIRKEFNQQTADIAKRIFEEVKGTGVSSVTTRTYKPLNEGKGFEVVLPRNYTLEEIIEIEIGGKKESFFLGAYGTFDEAEILIVEEIKLKYGKQPRKRSSRRKDGRSIRIDSETINSIRSQLRIR